MDTVEVMIDPGLIVGIDCDRSIEKSCQQILLHIPYIGRILFQTVQNILDVHGVQLHQPALYHFLLDEQVSARRSRIATKVSLSLDLSCIKMGISNSSMKYSS